MEIITFREKYQNFYIGLYKACRTRVLKPLQTVLCAYSMKCKLRSEKIVLEQADSHDYFMKGALNTGISQNLTMLTMKKICFAI